MVFILWLKRVRFYSMDSPSYYCTPVGNGPGGEYHLMWLASVIPWLFPVVLFQLPGLLHTDTVVTLTPCLSPQ